MEEITAAGLLFFFFYAEDAVEIIQVSSQAETTADVAEITDVETTSSG